MHGKYYIILVGAVFFLTCINMMARLHTILSLLLKFCMVFDLLRYFNSLKIHSKYFYFKLEFYSNNTRTQQDIFPIFCFHHNVRSSRFNFVHWCKLIKMQDNTIASHRWQLALSFNKFMWILII